MGYQAGVAADTLTHRLLAGDRTARNLLATTLLHDIPFRASNKGMDELSTSMPGKEDNFLLLIRLWKLRDEFGAAAEGVEKLFYWENQDYVSVSPEKCYATLLKHPQNGVLALISNLGRDTQTVSVEFNLDNLGLQGQKLDVFDPLTKEPVDISSAAMLSVSLESEDWVYVWLRPTGAK